MLVTLRVKDPGQSIRFYGPVLGFETVLMDEASARAVLPGLVIRLVKDTLLEAFHGPGAGRHRVGVGVVIHITVPDPPALAASILERGGFLVDSTADTTTVRDPDGYVLRFERG